jgi:hypothetical protein
MAGYVTAPPKKTPFLSPKQPKNRQMRRFSFTRAFGDVEVLIIYTICIYTKIYTDSRIHNLYVNLQ